MRNLKRVLSLVLALMMALSLMAFSSSASAASSTSFTVASELKGYDNVAEANREAVNVVVALDVIRGDTGDGTSDPDINASGNLKRAEAAVILARLVLGVEVTDDLPNIPTAYSDITADYLYATGAIQACTNMKLLAGNGDGTFEPAGTLTYAAFGKMLLGALGYNSEIEGYTNVGDLWVSNVAMGMTRAGISLSGVGLNDILTREQAMQMTFKALKARTVEYSPNTNIISYKTTDDVTGNISDNGPKVGYEYIELAEERFPELKLVSADNDEFGRPISTWKLNDEPIISTPAAEPVVITSAVTAGATDAATVRNLGLTGYTLANNEIAPVVDGVKQSEITAANNNARLAAIQAYTGNGTQVEIYTDGKAISNIVVVNTYVAKINNVTAATDGAEAYITLADVAGGTTIGTTFSGISHNFETNEFTKDDKNTVVLFTVAAEDAEDSTSQYISSVTVADAVTATPTYLNSNGYFRVDTTTYNYSANFEGTPIASGDVTGKVEKVLYLDNAGYVINIGTPEAATKTEYAMVLDTGAEGTVMESGTGTYYAELLFTDGSVETVKMDKVQGKTIRGTATNPSQQISYTDAKTAVLGKIVEYTVDNDVYQLDPNSNAAGTVADVTGITQGNPTLKAGLIANAKTIFLLSTNNGKSYTSYVGITSVPSVTFDDNSAVILVDTGVAQVVCVPNATLATSENTNKDLTFIAADSGVTISTASGTYTEYNAVTNGEIGTVDVKTGVPISNGLFDTVTTDNKGQISGAPSVTGTYASGTGILSGTGYEDVSDATVKLDSTNVLSWTEDTLVFEVDAEGKITQSSMQNLSDDNTTAIVFASVNKYVVEYLFVCPAAALIPADTYKLGTIDDTAAANNLSIDSITVKNSQGATVAQGGDEAVLTAGQTYTIEVVLEDTTPTANAAMTLTLGGSNVTGSDTATVSGISATSADENTVVWNAGTAALNSVKITFTFTVAGTASDGDTITPTISLSKADTYKLASIDDTADVNGVSISGITVKDSQGATVAQGGGTAVLVSGANYTIEVALTDATPTADVPMTLTLGGVNVTGAANATVTGITATSADKTKVVWDAGDAALSSAKVTFTFTVANAASDGDTITPTISLTKANTYKLASIDATSTANDVSIDSVTVKDSDDNEVTQNDGNLVLVAGKNYTVEVVLDGTPAADKTMTLTLGGSNVGSVAEVEATVTGIETSAKDETSITWSSGTSAMAANKVIFTFTVADAAADGATITPTVTLTAAQ